jgi:hypothetical protein
MRARLFVIVLTLVVLVLVPGSQGSAQAPLDPQALIGEWVGKWVAITMAGGGSRRAGGREAPYALTINRVQGNRVLARLENQGFSGNINATLSGNRLTFGNEQFQTVLTVEGDEMRGTRQGGGAPPYEITLAKKK